MSELLALAERCERSVGWDRQLDGLIWAAMQGVKLIAFDCSLTNTEKLSWDGELKYPNRPGVDYFTGSTDAAITLVPEGMIWTRDAFGEFKIIRWAPSGIALDVASGKTLPAAALRAAATASANMTR